MRRAEIPAFAFAVLIGLLLCMFSPGFLAGTNLFDMLDLAVVLGIATLGLTLVLITGGVDLSMGAVAALSGAALGLSLHHLPVPAALGLAVLTGASAGLVSGLLVAFASLPPFAVTLGVAAIAGSCAELMAGGASPAIPESVRSLVYASLAGVPFSLVLLLLLYAASAIYMGHIPGGRALYAVGSNREAARSAGLRVRWSMVQAYLVSGICAALAAMFSASRAVSDGGPATSAFTLHVLAAATIGGVSLYGGRGSVLGSFLGVIIMVLIHAALHALGAPAVSLTLVDGVVIIGAVMLDRLRRNHTSRQSR